jgi:hypothetical protein
VIQIGSGARERFLDAQPGAPQDHDQAAEPAVWPLAGSAHDGDDLLHLRWIGRVNAGPSCAAADRREIQAWSLAIKVDQHDRAAARTCRSSLS